MKKLPEKLNGYYPYIPSMGNEPLEKTMQVVDQLIDYLAEREKEGVEVGMIELASQSEATKHPTPLFKAEDISLWESLVGDWNITFKSKAQAEQAREALLKLSNN